MAIVTIEGHQQDYPIIAKKVVSRFEIESSVILDEQMGFYDELTVKDSVEFYTKISKYSKPEVILEDWNLEDSKNKSLKKVDSYTKALLYLCFGYLISDTNFIMWDPLKDLTPVQQEDILAIIQKYFSTYNLYIISDSFRNVCHFTGDKYYYQNKELIPIMESIDPSMSQNITQHPLRIKVKVGSKTIVIGIKDISYIESVGGIAYIYIHDTLIPTTYSMDHLENKLKHYGFFRCHRSYIVNIQKVTEINSFTRNSYSINISSNDLSIPLSKRRYQDFLNLYSSDLDI